MAEKELSELVLSDPGAKLSQDSTMSEYLRCYQLPQPPGLRYGCIRFSSPQANHRVSLFGQAWLPAHAVGTVILTHGFSEHSANYARLIQDFLDAQLAVAALDLRGHGLSEGSRGHTDTPDAYAEDVERFIELVLPKLTPNRPLYLWGHSLGAMITLQLVLRKKMPVKPSAIAVTSAFVGFPELFGIQKMMAGLAPMIDKLLPTLPIAHGVMPQNLTHDAEYLAMRALDPLIGRVATPRWLISCKKSIHELQARSQEFADLTPTLFLLAGEELITNANEARRFAFSAYAQLKHKVIEFPGCRHELEKEPAARARVVSESIAWLTSHT